MNKILLCGQHNHRIIPIQLCAAGCVISGDTTSNNNSIGKAESRFLLCGLYNNQLIPLQVTDNGELT